MTRILIAVLLLAQCQFAAAEAIEYEIYELSKGGAGPKLIAKGKREYSLKDVEVHPYQRN